MAGIAVIDIFFLVLIALLVIRCAFRGFIGEIMAVAAFLLGLLTSLFFYKNGGIFVREKFMPDTKVLPEVIAFIVLFFIVFILVKILEWILKDIIDRVSLGGVDRFLGILLGLAEGIAVTGLVLFVLSIQPLFDPAALLERSIFAGLLLPLIGGHYGGPPAFLPAEFPDV
ncbi:MAG: CvpA family protein [Treponema sp.]|jgi:membrane protein required for colicin V production|nr:CvpA family protein [Treponema sp.]